MGAIAACAAPAHRIDGEAGGGFAVYRSGALTREELAELCAAGVEEMVVLDGTARRRECAWRDEVCPGLRVRYDEEQDADLPLDAGFLARFDAWVEEARRAGLAVAFRCTHGWHRTGRLAGYYALRHQGWESEAARREMHRLGQWMGMHPSLDEQVEALADRVAGRRCDEPAEVCVAPAPREVAGTFPGTFPEDVCP